MTINEIRKNLRIPPPANEAEELLRIRLAMSLLLDILLESGEKKHPGIKRLVTDLIAREDKLSKREMLG